MALTARLGSFACSAVLCVLALGAGPGPGASGRVTVEGLVSAAPVPAGFDVTRKDVKNGEQLVGHYLILAKEGSPTRGVVQIERREIAERRARVATLKAYANAAAATWQKQGYSLKARGVPNFETVDFAKPVSIELDATKEGESPVAIHMEVFFDQFAYQVMCVSTDAAEAKPVIEWCKSVRPLTEGPAAGPAK